MDIGIFSGLWSGVSTTLGQGAAEISELTGSADKKRAQEYALAQLKAQTTATTSAQKTKIYIIVGVVLFMIVILLMSKKN